MPKFAGTPVEPRFQGTLEPIQNYNVPEDQVPEFLRKRSAVEQEVAKLPTDKTRFNKWNQEQLFFADLQDKYGDEDTINQRYENRPEMRAKLYDRKELLRRKMVDELGFEPKKSWNPLVHLGKELSDIGYGIKQAIPFLQSSDEKKADYARWQAENQLYTAADQPFVSQFAGGALLGAPFGLANVGTKAATGYLLKNLGKRELGENMLREASFSGSTMLPKLTPGTVGLTEGALYGAAQPVDPNKGYMDQLVERVGSAAGYGLLGVVPEILMRGGGRVGQKALTRALKEDAQMSLPKPVKAPTPALYNDAKGVARIEQIGRQSITGNDAARDAARKMLNDWDESLETNLKAMNRNMTGSNNLEIGTSIAPVMTKYKQAYEASKRNVNRAYDAVAGGNRYINADLTAYKQFLNSLDADLAARGFVKTKAAKTGYNELKRLIDVDPDAMEFNGMELIGRYKALNEAYASAKPAQRSAIEYMKEQLVNFMDNPSYFAGNADALQRFKSATAIAKDHYRKFTGIKSIDQYLAGEITASDISRKIFSGTTLDQTEGPKAQIVKKILDFDPDARRNLKNEVFANLSHEFDESKQVKDALIKIQRKILSGSDEGIHGQLFDANELGQFRDFVKASDLRNAPEKGMSTTGTFLKSDIAAVSPFSWMRLPGKSQKARDMTFIKRAEEGLLSPTSGLTSAGVIPTLMSEGQTEKENQVYSGLLNSLLQ